MRARHAESRCRMAAVGPSSLNVRGCPRRSTASTPSTPSTALVPPACPANLYALCTLPLPLAGQTRSNPVKPFSNLDHLDYEQLRRPVRSGMESVPPKVQGSRISHISPFNPPFSAPHPAYFATFDQFGRKSTQVPFHEIFTHKTKHFQSCSIVPNRAKSCYVFEPPCPSPPCRKSHERSLDPKTPN